MIVGTALILCIAALAALVLLQRRRNKRKLEDTARMRALQRWRAVLEEDGDPGESFVEYQKRKQLRP